MVYIWSNSCKFHISSETYQPNIENSLDKIKQH